MISANIWLAAIVISAMPDRAAAQATPPIPSSVVVQALSGSPSEARKFLMDSKSKTVELKVQARSYVYASGRSYNFNGTAGPEGRLKVECTTAHRPTALDDNHGSLVEVPCIGIISSYSPPRRDNTGRALLTDGYLVIVPTPGT